MDGSKMAEAVEEGIENALNLVVSTAEQSSNIRKALKEKIFETVSKLCQLFVKIKISVDRNLNEISNSTKKVSKLETELQSCRRSKPRYSKRHLLMTLTSKEGRQQGYTARHLSVRPRYQRRWERREWRSLADNTQQ